MVFPAITLSQPTTVIVALLLLVYNNYMIKLIYVQLQLIPISCTIRIRIFSYVLLLTTYVYIIEIINCCTEYRKQQRIFIHC